MPQIALLCVLSDPPRKGLSSDLRIDKDFVRLGKVAGKGSFGEVSRARSRLDGCGVCGEAAQEEGAGAQRPVSALLPSFIPQSPSCSLVSLAEHLIHVSFVYLCV